MKCIPVFLFCAAAVFAQPFTFATGQAARLVIGQTTFTTQDTNTSNTRVLLFNNLSSQLPAPTAELTYNSKCPVCVGTANVVLGQPDFVTTTQYSVASSNTLRTPTGVASDGVHLVVADTDENRVLIWNHIPTGNDQPADVVVGQPNFTSVSLPG